MSGWKDLSLGEICEFKYGKSLPEGKRQGDSFPVYGSNGIVGKHFEPLTKGPTIVIGRKGSFGVVTFSDGACFPIDTTYYVDSSATNCDLKWLYYQLGTLGLTDLNRAAAVPGLNREDAYRKRVLVPPIEEQRRIAQILDCADALRAKRRESIEQICSLTQSIFLEMFGDPSVFGWEMRTIADVVHPEKGSIRTGPFGSQLLHSEFVESGVAVLGIDNAVANEFRWGERRFITETKYQALKRYTVKPGDVLITIMGTCGRVAIVPADIPVAINTKHLCAITLDQSKCLPSFLHSYFLMHPQARFYLGKKAKGAIMDGLNMGIIKEMPIPMAPLDLQKKYEAKLSKLSVIKGKQNRAHVLADELFGAIQQKAFSGEI